MMKKLIYKIAFILLTLQIMAISACAQTLFEVEVRGEGQPMLFLPGLYSTGDVWDAAVDYYSQNYECHIFTLAGFGDVPAIEKTPYLKTIRDGIIDYARKHHLKDAILVAHSMGGFIALWAAAAAPHLFKAIISVDGVPFLPVLTMPGVTKEKAANIAVKIKKGMSTQTKEEVKASLKKYLPTMIQDKEDRQMVFQMGLKSDPQTQGQIMYELFTTDLRDDIATIESPVLVLGSWIAYKKYGVTAESALAAYKRQFHNVENVTIKMTDESLHFIFLDQPRWFRKQVDAFLQQTK